MARQLIIQLVGDASRFSRDINRALGATESRLKKFQRTSAIALGAFSAAAVAVGKDVIDVASSAAEMQSQVRTVLGKHSKLVEDFADTAANAYGQSRKDALAYAGAFASLAKVQGLASAGAAAMGVQYSKLASDLASFNDVSVQDAFEALRSGLSGEFEPLKRMKVFINDNVLAQEALRIGLKKTGSTWTAQQKLLLTHNAIMRQTAEQQGDFARTSEGLANQQRILTAQITNLKEEMGKALLPAAVEVVKKLNEFASWAKNNPKFIDQVKVAVIGLTAAFTSLAIAQLAVKLTNPFAWVGIAITAITALSMKFESVRVAAEGFLMGVKWLVATSVQSIVEGVARVIEGALIGLETAFGWVPFGIGEKLKNARQQVSGFIADTRTMFDSIRDFDVNLTIRTHVADPIQGPGTYGVDAERIAALQRDRQAREAAGQLASSLRGMDLSSAPGSKTKAAAEKVKKAAIKVGRAWVDGLKVGIDHSATTVKDAIQAVIDAAKDKLQQARDLAREVRRTFAMTLNAMTFDASSGVRSASLVYDLDQQVKRIKAFSKTIRELKAKGLHKFALNDLMDQGPQGLEAAQEILNSRGAIGDVNRLTSDLRQEQDTLANWEVLRRTGTDLRKDQPVKVVFDIKGADGEMKNLIKKIVRVEGGGNVQVAFGR